MRYCGGGVGHRNFELPQSTLLVRDQDQEPQEDLGVLDFLQVFARALVDLDDEEGDDPLLGIEFGWNNEEGEFVNVQTSV